MSTINGIPASLLQDAHAVGTTDGSKGNQDISKQEFLTLFIKQLQAQDPLSPLSPDQLTAQLAQFSSLEQLTQMNTTLGTLASNTQKSDSTAMIGLIGKKVAFDGSDLSVKNGQSAPVDFTLSSSAAEVVAKVTASDGTVVRTVPLGAKGAGEHSFAFDGRDDAGALVPDGSYSVTITAAATAGTTGAQIALNHEVTVDGVDLSSDPPALLAGTTRITLDKVRQVHDAGA
jgi:flagellar basal-body rod modification protein FlgD